ncbi:MAG: hypothetical protein J7L08_02295 [Candidatus Aenigmarchaeota archaeon]|nr:hypothetical protein [Candidatus Aenigmarchaeota archaeon]
MMENFSEIIPLDETAGYLRTKKSTLSKFARKDKIPSRKIEIGKKEIRSKTIEVYNHVSREKGFTMKKTFGNILKGC